MINKQSTSFVHVIKPWPHCEVSLLCYRYTWGTRSQKQLFSHQVKNTLERLLHTNEKWQLEESAARILVHHSHSWLKMRKEIRTMCSDNIKSSLQSQSKEKLTSGLSWDQLHSELSKNAPTLLSFLQACTKTRVARPNTKAVVGVCAAIILKHRQPKMNLLQKIISLILYAGHASKVISSNVTIS